MLEKLQQIISDFYDEHKTAFLGLLTAIILALVGGGGYVAGQQNPAPAAVEQAISARVSPTPAPGRPATATAKPVITNTPKPATATGQPPALTATKTSIPGSTSTPGGIVTPTPSGATVTPAPTGIGGCPVHENLWHAPQDIVCQHHHHGIDPTSDKVKAIFNIDGFDIQKDFINLYGQLWQPLWLSSPAEPIEFPTGFIWALFENPTCSQFDPAPGHEGYDCVVAVLYRFHDPGTLSHLVHRLHSEAAIVKACEKKANGQPDMSQCGIISMPGMLADYGTLGIPYKTNICHLQNEPGYPFPDALQDQPDYRTSSNRLGSLGENVQYWVRTEPNAVVAFMYPTNPNAFLDVAWDSADAWQIWNGDKDGKPTDCDLPGTLAESIAATKAQVSNLSEYPPIPGLEHKTFQLVNLTIDEHPPGPFFGYYDVFGHPRPGCTAPTGWDAEDGTPLDSCVPYIITANFPDGGVSLKFQAEGRGTCSEILPCFVAETFGVDMVFPSLDVP